MTYIGHDGREYEDGEMDNMRRDAREEQDTMHKVAFVDLDRVVANPQARFAKAEEAKLAYINVDATVRLKAALIGARSAIDFYWREAFNPIHVPLDELVDGADGDIIALTLQNYIVVFLTSRPSSMRIATLAWLEFYNLLASDEFYRLVMKESAFQYTKTIVWKAGMVQTLAAMLEASEVLFITDQQVEIDELQRFEHPFLLRVALSLDEAVNGKDDEEEDDPGHPF